MTLKEKTLLNTINKVKVIANNCLYFDDSSDYCSCLWEILSIVGPELSLEGVSSLNYIEEDE